MKDAYASEKGDNEYFAACKVIVEDVEIQLA